MNDIGTPAWRPTASCTWRAFRSSGKKHLLLTGGRDSGKTTLLRALQPLLSAGPWPGVTTWARPGAGVWLRQEPEGAVVRAGRFDPALPGPENRMRPTGGFDALGVEALEQAARAPGQWAAIDEIGYLECGSPAYCQAILRLMGSKRLLAAVRKQDLPFLRQLCARPDVFCLDLDRPLGRAGCVVMASGQGRRFGGNKLLAPLGGRPLLSYVLASTEGLFARRVVVTRNPDTAALCRQQGIQTVLHSLPGRSDTIRLGLEAATAEGTLDGCLFCPGDQPLLRRETAAALALCGAAVPDKIWRAAWQGTPGAPVWFPAWSFGELAALSQDQGGGWVLRRHPEQVGLVEASSGAELADVDTREDLQRMQSGYME